ncbi:MAG: glycosyltransferase family 4 protein [Oscillospiraceae bacterium]|nr:glycosyltransferase family 4 protein [Oscillospiraceae bacterium]
MKVYIYSEAMDKIKKSGVGRAIYHQMNAVEKNGVEVVDDIEDADVVHINTVLPKSLALAKKLKKKGVPLVYHAHSTKEDFRNSYIGANAVSGLFKKWIIKCYTQGDVIVTPSEYSKSLLRGYGIKNRVFVISNGIDLEDYVRSETAGRNFRRKFGFTEDDKVIVSAGLLMKRKGVDDFAELARRLPQYKFVWFGDADMKFVGKEIRDAVKNAPKNCIFAGYVKKPVLQAALSGSDLFLFPSREETEGIVVLEALALKTPVLLRDIPVYGDWIRKGENAYAAKDIDEFEELAVKILEGELPDLSEEGYKTVSEKSIEKVGARLKEAYEKAIEISDRKNGRRTDSEKVRNKQ